ncbi:hypothetical protein QP178_04765 [Sphingomonas aurantiaca]|uniref:hypothetical protein n=1 Tax=Sphingomonas aurantiaca TaxID=185949 RepID=UPI002FE27FD6
MADLVSIIMGSTGSLAAVWLGSRFAEVKRVREQAWDRKALAYSEILDALNEMKRYLDGAYEDALRRRDRSAEEDERRVGIYRAASDQLGKAISRQSWILPEPVQSSVEHMEKVLHAEYTSWEEDLDASAYACGIALRDIRFLARDDMAAPRMLPAAFRRLPRLRRLA